MALKTLEQCVGLWGRSCILDGLPRIRCVEEATYLPWSHGGAWGVFTNEGASIAESVNMRTIDNLPSGPQPSYPETGLRIEDRIDDTYLYLGLLNAHYGHFVVNCFSRFWPLVFGRSRLPKLLWHTIGPKENYRSLEFLATVLSGLGTSVDDITTFDRPVRIKRILVPETSFHEQFYCFPVFRLLASIVGTPLYDFADVDSVAQPVFLSKAQLKSGVGRFEGEDIIEDGLRRAGVRIVHPELLSFKDQVRLFAYHRTILSTSGSALHTSVFSPPRRHIISVNPMREVNSNFAMIDELNRNVISYYVPRGMTYTSHTNFITQHHAPDPQGIVADLVSLL